MADLQRVYNVPLRREFSKVAKYKRAKRAVGALKTFITKHMKAEKVLIGKFANEKIWERGIKNPPHHIKVEATKDSEGIVRVELVGKKFDKIDSVKKDKPSKKQEKDIKEKPKEEKKESKEEIETQAPKQEDKKKASQENPVVAQTPVKEEKAHKEEKMSPKKKEAQKVEKTPVAKE